MFLIFVLEPDAQLIVSLVSDNGTMLIYRKTDLVWAAQLNDVPVAICRSNLNGLAGAIVILSQNGKVNVSYLGSEPQLFEVPPLNLQKMNFEKTQTELVELEKEIKKGIDFTDASMSNAKADHDLSVELAIDSSLETSRYPTKIASSTIPSDDMKVASVKILLHAHTSLEQIQVQLHVSAALKCTRDIWSFQDMAIDKREQLESKVYVEHNIDITSAAVTAIVSFINKHSIPRVIEKKKFLPLTMFYRLNQPQKDAVVKLTVNVDKAEAPSIDQLFSEDFVLDPNLHVALGLKSIYSGKIVTIVTGKHSNRYRYVCDNKLCY